jgi:hypothetical protein
VLYIFCVALQPFPISQGPTESVELKDHLFWLPYFISMFTNGFHMPISMRNRHTITATMCCWFGSSTLRRDSCSTSSEWSSNLQSSFNVLSVFKSGIRELNNHIRKHLDPIYHDQDVPLGPCCLISQWQNEIWFLAGPCLLHPVSLCM